MDSRWNEDEEKQINKYNGQYVTATLLFLGGKATKNELLSHIASTTSQPYHQVVEQELNRILNNGVGYGFITKIGNKYLFPTQQNEKLEVDADVRTLGTTKRKSEDLDCEWEDVDDEDDYLNLLEEMTKLDCRLFRNKLLDKIIDVVMDEKGNARSKRTNALLNQILHVSTIPEEHIDAFTKNKLTNFYSSAFDLLVTHDVRTELVRYTFLSLDKHIMDVNMHKFTAEKQKAMKRYVNDVEQLEKGDCEKFRIVYINHLLHKITEALQQGTKFASELFIKLNIQDKNAELSCTLRNFVHMAFVLRKSDNSPVEAYFKFLSDRKAKEPKRKAKGRPRGGAARKRKRT